MMSPVYLQAMGQLSALGAGAAGMRAGLFAAQYPDSLQCTERYSPQRPLPLGMLPAQVRLPDLDFAAPAQRSRNNALAWAAAQQIRLQVDAAIARFGAHRVALVIGTSTAGVEEGEAAARQLLAQGRFPPGFDYALQEMGNVAQFLARHLGIAGPAHVISTACSSGAKALASAARLLRSGMADAVVAGGVDALCSFTVAGFSALESVSAQRCNPLSRNRQGINLGEAAALFLVGRDAGPVRLAGWGESQDAHHMSAPDPSGQGAMRAMEQALALAQVPAAAVDYVNLHGTATPHNDAMESLAVHSLLGPQVPVSSTKPLTGHTLAAAGALEAAVAWQVLVDNPRGRLPPHWWDGAADPALPAMQLVTPGMSLGRPVRHVLSNSFAFGGSNAALLLAAQ
ncbi:beta-ketoacyl-ACP synthase [Acidovorax sp. Be4]|uniref:Beta-ketoacyl-ACP synthase n=2 Tax=Acidovorax bellezanensis TaxID=2976702 RepID=A0ABT2PRU5_9BURK|nr:beta-ketoacyl-ACP synthase [Acidovorax sp. Be4]MCT9812943.1 beta-ketoacyl-ACP synthase [Acidovorax sp. Be4]